MYAYKDPETQITLTVFSSLYLDWGLAITDRDGTELYSSPHALSAESYGFHWTDENENDLEEGIDWAPKDWQECLASELDDLVDAFVGWHNLTEDTFLWIPYKAPCDQCEALTINGMFCHEAGCPNA